MPGGQGQEARTLDHVRTVPNRCNAEVQRSLLGHASAQASPGEPKRSRLVIRTPCRTHLHRSSQS